LSLACTPRESRGFPWSGFSWSVMRPWRSRKLERPAYDIQAPCP
jgi:hypothetical protein